jgi:VWFA-related protein
MTAANAMGISALAACLLCASSGPIPAIAQETESAEVTTHEADTTFKMQVERNLVLVRAVVRDSKGRTVGSLKKEDFRVTDNGKPQTISHFAVEVPASKAGELRTPAEEEQEPEALPETVLATSTPVRYVALFFDDIHMQFEDIARIREAAERHLATALQPGDRVGIFTASGRKAIDFTDDRGKLHETLLQLTPSPIAPRRERNCPDISGYQAYLIVHGSDPVALEIATEEAYHCLTESLARAAAGTGTLAQQVEATARALARQQAESQAMASLTASEVETEACFRSLDQLVRRMAAAPGQRSVVLISPGFITLTRERELDAIVDRALRANVVINTLDSRGLYVLVPFGDASKQDPVVTRLAYVTGQKMQLTNEESRLVADVLSRLAHDTGGVSFGNSNDLDEGFHEVGSLPEVYYVLGFSPQNLKLDGGLHSLKVTLNLRAPYTIQARSAYYAPRKPVDPAAQAQEEIEQAVFSHDELNELPIEVHTQFFKLNDVEARLSVVTRLDVRFVHFRKESGRNLNNLILVTALFDRDGKFMTGKEKSLEFRLLDGSLERLARSGITTKTSFDVKAGTYMIRQVVRDAEGAQLSALNRTVEIPF